MTEAEIERLDKRVSLVLPILNERQRRLYLAAEAMTDTEGSLSQLSRISGVSRTTIASGIKELQEDGDETSAAYSVRKSGAGRKKIDEEFPDLLFVLEELMEKAGRTDSLLIWCGMSIREIRAVLKQTGHWIGRTTVSNALQNSGYLYHDTGGDLDQLMDILQMINRPGMSVIDLEIIGKPTEPLPDKIWGFIRNWWKTDQVIVVSSLPDREAEGVSGIRYFRYPTGYMKWKQRKLCATLRVEEQDGNLVRCMLWQVN